MDPSVHPPIVTRLHYEFDGWLGDALLESFPCWIVTMAAKDRIRSLRLTGVDFADVEVTTSGEFQDFYPNRQLPKFCWLQVKGEAGHDNFGIADDHRLVVSERALEALKDLGIARAVVEEFAS